MALSKRLLLVIGLLTLPAFRTWAEVTLPALLTEHMVVQRGVPVHVWGKASPGEGVSVDFRGETRTATTDAFGRWSIYLRPGEAGGPFEMTVKGGGNAVSLKDVLVGDVWVASGQSNMELPLSEARNANAEIAAAKYPKIRLLRVERKASEYPLDDVVASPWAECSPETASGFSAVAYFFARHLEEKLGVPIGVIESAWGGSAAEDWTSLSALSADPSLMPVFAERALQMKEHPTALLDIEEEIRKLDRATAEAKAQGRPAPNPPWIHQIDWHGPAELYNGMIAPLTALPIRGVIWYQGERNTSFRRAQVYSRLLETLIRDWRQQWGQGDLPFLFVQLPNAKVSPGAWGTAWPELREAQRQTLELRNTGMAVTIDLGEGSNLHPKNKQDVGLRLALAALAISYGETIEYSGPTWGQTTPQDHSLRVWFDHADGLTARGGTTLKGFEVAGADRKFESAEAHIEGTSVVVAAPAVESPKFVRYAWSDNPDANLYNSAGLPASPFQSGK